MNPAIFAKIKEFFGEFEFGIGDFADPQHHKVWTRSATERMLPYLTAMNAQGRHIFIRPTLEREGFHVLHDDASRAGILKHHGFDVTKRPAHAWAGRLIIETSPGSYQAWVRLAAPMNNEEKKAWLASVNSDPGAAPNRRWGRAPGWRNVKHKHQLADGSFPLARLIWVNSTPQTHLDVFAAPGTAPRNIAPARRQNVLVPTLADRERFNTSGDDSATDIRWCMSLLARGLGAEAVRAALHGARESVGWNQHNPDDYVSRTVRRALDFLGRS